MKSRRHSLVKRRARRSAPLRSHRRPIPLPAARPAADEYEAFDLGVVHAVYGAAPPDVATWYEYRRDRGIDRHDEVWDGVYVVAPEASNEHQDLVGELTLILKFVVGDRGKVYPGANVSDREAEWSKNFRGPDVAVVLKNNKRCEDRASHFFGGPDFVVEVESPGDRSRLKFDFYARVGVREFLILEHKTRRPLLYRLRDGEFEPVAEKDDWVASRVVPLAFSGQRGRLRVKATRRPFKQWTIGG